MRNFRFGLPVGFLAGLLLLGGCGGGEIVPLVAPAGDADFATDPRWQMQTGLLDDAPLLGATWPAGGRPVVVGAKGFVAENLEPGHWRLEDSGVSCDLARVVGDGAGGLLAVGLDGGALRQPDGTWQPMNGLPSGAAGLVHGAGAYWMIGLPGELIRIDGDGAVSEVPGLPETRLRAVLAETDSLFVTGEGIGCQVRVGGVWSTLDVPVPEEGYAKSIFRLDDGRLLMVVRQEMDTVYVREAHGWVPHPEINPENGSIICHYEDGYLWVWSSYRWWRWDVRGESWTSLLYPRGGIDFVGFGPDGTIVWGWTGAFFWAGEDAEGEIFKLRDPAFAMTFRRLYSLLDGTVVASAGEQIHTIEATGSRPVLSLVTAGPLTRIAGASLQDFYFLAGGLFHYVDGQEPQEMPLPEGVGEGGLAVDAAGRVMVSHGGDVCIWDGVQWTCLPNSRFSDNRALTTRQQTLVALGMDRDAVYLGPNGLVRVLLPFHAIGASEPEPGLLVFYSSNLESCLYWSGTGISLELEGNLLPSGDGVHARSFVETDTGGVCLAYDSHLVLGITVSGARAQRELVAGPWKNQIKELQVLPDGSLAALDDPSGRLLIYPAQGD
ncbi:hypothetical protein CSB20_01820 [bacterium DOLZORAL124_64_63]|nr:MAG: hypothetical protein CSB20_01820 [bacterium DOLZORAL124_64_63]